MKAARIFYTIAPVILIALLAVFVMTGCKDQENMAIAESNSREIAAIPVTVAVVEPVSIRDVVFLPGETEAYEDVKVAANAAGRVEWIGPSEGQTVQKGVFKSFQQIAAFDIVRKKGCAVGRTKRNTWIVVIGLLPVTMDDVFDDNCTRIMAHAGDKR